MKMQMMKMIAKEEAQWSKERIKMKEREIKEGIKKQHNLPTTMLRTRIARIVKRPTNHQKIKCHKENYEAIKKGSDVSLQVMKRNRVGE